MSRLTKEVLEQLTEADLMDLWRSDVYTTMSRKIEKLRKKISITGGMFAEENEQIKAMLEQKRSLSVKNLQSAKERVGELKAEGRTDFIGDPQFLRIKGRVETVEKITIDDEGERDAYLLFMENIPETTEVADLYTHQMDAISYAGSQRSVLLRLTPQQKPNYRLDLFGDLTETEKKNMKMPLGFGMLASYDKAFILLHRMVIKTYLPIRPQYIYRLIPNYLDCVPPLYIPRGKMTSQDILHRGDTWKLPLIRETVKPFTAFPRTVRESTPYRPTKFLICDAEVCVGPTPNGFRQMAPIMAYAVVEDQKIVQYKVFTDVHATPKDVEAMGRSKNSKLEAVMANVRMTAEGTYEAYDFNGGYQGFRQAICEFHKNGYRIYSKGCHTEALYLSGYGVKAPAKFRKNPCDREETRDGLRVRPNRALHDRWYHENLHELWVYEWGGPTYDELSKTYFDAWDWELLLTAWESRYTQRKHHPLIEVVTFAAHYVRNILLNRVSSPDYINAYGFIDRDGAVTGRVLRRYESWTLDYEEKERAKNSSFMMMGTSYFHGDEIFRMKTMREREEEIERLQQLYTRIRSYEKLGFYPRDLKGMIEYPKGQVAGEHQVLDSET